MVLKKHKISQNILQDIRAGPTAQPPLFIYRDPADRGTIKTPGFISMLEISTGVTDFCKFIVAIGARATADSSIVLFS